MATLAHPAAPVKANGVVRIVIADSHAMFREALKRLLRVEPDFQVIAEAEDGLGAIAIVREARPHVVLLDLDLPRCSGLDALRGICNAWPPTLPLLLVDSIDDQQLVEALCLGARGVALKTAATDLLFKSIRAVVAGEYWLERNRVPLLIQSLNHRLHSRGQDNHHNLLGLNQREFELMAAIADGESTRDVAGKLSLSEVTVRHQLTNIFRKLHVRNRGELLSLAISNNLGGNGDGLRRLTPSVQGSADLDSGRHGQPRGFPDGPGTDAEPRRGNRPPSKVPMALRNQRTGAGGDPPMGNRIVAASRVNERKG